jgi:hypothetical protein
MVRRSDTSLRHVGIMLAGTPPEYPLWVLLDAPDLICSGMDRGE